MKKEAVSLKSNEYEYGEFLKKIEGTYLHPFLCECYELTNATSLKEKNLLWDEICKTNGEDESLRLKFFKIMATKAAKIALNDIGSAPVNEVDEILQDVMVALHTIIIKGGTQRWTFAAFNTRMYRESHKCADKHTTHMQEQEILMPDVRKQQHLRALLEMEREVEKLRLWKAVITVLDSIRLLEKTVIQERYGISQDEGPTTYPDSQEFAKTFSQIGRELNYTGTYIKVVYTHAIRKLQHPSRSKQLKKLNSPDEM